MNLYKYPPAHAKVICMDEMGVISAKTYPGTHLQPHQDRPKMTPDYGRRGYTWVFGAFEPHTGQALTWCTPKRNTASFLDFLDQIVATWNTDNLYLILDNLSIHKTTNVLLWALQYPQVHFLFQPTYSPWLNLIEPWWKTLRSLALKGKTFLNQLQIIDAIDAGTQYWNDHAKPYTWRREW